MKRARIWTSEDVARDIRTTKHRIQVDGVTRQLWIQDGFNDTHPWFGWVRMFGRFQYVRLIDDADCESVWVVGSSSAVVIKEESPMAEA